jgi:uncharacterized protein
VILIDANILLYAYIASSPHHEAAVRWLTSAMERREEIGLPWISILAFIRIITGPALSNAATLEAAIASIDDLLAESNVILIHPSVSHWQLLQRTLRAGQANRELVNDAHLAALAIEHNAALCTNDRDFARFPGLKIVNPIAKQ